MPWEAAVDDLLVERWQACTLCATKPATYGGVWDLSPSPLALSFVFCRRCEGDMGASEARLETLLRQRYGIDPGGSGAESQPA